MTLAELGARLREAREGRDMTVADVADRLKIPTRILQGIEEASDRLPRTVYVHHFIKEYALLLDFAPEDVSEWLKGLEGFENVSRPVIAESATYTSVKPSVLPVILGWLLKVVLVLALASGAYMAYLHFFAARDSERSSTVSGEQAAPAAPMPTWGSATPAAQTPPAASSVTSAPEESLPQSDAAPAEEAGVAPSEAASTVPSAPAQSENAASSVEQSSSTPADASPAAEATPVVLPDGMHQVEVVADTGDCWMGFEPDGKKQQRTLRKGDTFSMTFRDSLVIRLGNARAVRVMYDGKELERSTSPRVVTMSFPPAE